MKKLYVVIGYTTGELYIEAFDNGVRFTKEIMHRSNVEWLYFAQSESDALTAQQYFSKDYKLVGEEL